MTPYSPRIIAPALLLLSAASLLAQDTIDTAGMLQQLRELKEKRSQALGTQTGKVIAAFQQAAASDKTAIDFYEQAVRVNRFEGKSRDSTQFRDWKKKEDANLRSHDMQAAVRLHLNYLVLSIQCYSGAETKDLINPLIAYTRQVLGAGDGVTSHGDMMRKPITDSVFVQWYAIGGWMSELKHWELSPGNVDGIYNKVILPEFRDTVDPRLLEYWDMKIQRESEKAARSQLTLDVDTFQRTRKPELLWNRAQDILLLGQTNRAIVEMFNVVRTYPAHKNFEQWVGRLESLLKPPAPPETTPSAATSPTPAPQPATIPATAPAPAPSNPLPPPNQVPLR